MDSLEDYLEKVMADMNWTWPKFEQLKARIRGELIHTQPIPFFGDAANAKVLTVGVNPSAREFSKIRQEKQWPPELSQMTAIDLNNRLRNGLHP